MDTMTSLKGESGRDARQSTLRPRLRRHLLPRFYSALRSVGAALAPKAATEFSRT